jgi:hypothetical protein
MEQAAMAWAWLTENWDLVLEGLGAAYAFASVVVALTPTPRDDAALASVRRFVVRLSFLSPRDVAGVVSMPGSLPDPDDDRAEPDD